MSRQLGLGLDDGRLAPRGTAQVYTETGAEFSPCGRYRWRLWRTWGPGPLWAFVGLNPSTADAELDDHTIRRCRSISKAHGAGGLIMLNLYGLRSTDPAGLWEADDPVGPACDQVLREQARRAHLVVACWGMTAGPGRAMRIESVRGLLAEAGRELHCLGTTSDGHPRHPSRLPGLPQPEPWQAITRT